MGIFNASFILGTIILLYVGSFVVFAILRIATGISIQRLGYFCLRRVAYTPRDGIRLEIRSLGLQIHRPTFAQPTWISLRLDGCKLIVDIEALSRSVSRKQSSWFSSSESPTPKRPILRQSSSWSAGSKAWSRLTKAKDWLKKLHDKIHLIRLVDLFARNSSLIVLGVGHFDIGTLIMMVDTRQKTAHRSRLFQHKTIVAHSQPAEWMLTIKGVLFTKFGSQALEVVDIATLNVHGSLYRDLPGLRDTSITAKLSRVHVPYDDLLAFHRDCRVRQNTPPSDSGPSDLAQSISESKAFVRSLLHGIQEVELAASFIGLRTKLYPALGNTPLYLNVSMNEFGIDLHRLDSQSPAHRMYFSPKDVAHQALLAAISISVSLDREGTDQPERLLYIPMATTTLKTTLPSKTVTFSQDKAERNTNIVFGNLVLTSPSLDLSPSHLPWISTFLNRPSTRETPHESLSWSHSDLQSLLPKASIKVSVHEPVLRITLPPSKTHLQDAYDLLIFSISSIAFDLESSHASVDRLDYSVTSTLRFVDLRFYYQTYQGEKHEIVTANAFEFENQATAAPSLSVALSGNLKAFAVYIVRPEISQGIQHLSKHLGARPPASSTSRSDVLRALPEALSEASFHGSDIGAEVAGVDKDISCEARGAALQLHSWSISYRRQRETKTKHSIATDGRRATLHLRGLRISAFERFGKLEMDPFLDIPRFEAAFSTTSDAEGPIFHINSFVKSVRLEYSLYRFYSVGVATTIFRKALALSSHSPKATIQRARQITTIDVRSDLVQVKAVMAADPKMMLQIYGFEAGQHRWAQPFMRSLVLRLYCAAPHVQDTWARIISLKSLRADLREVKKKKAGKVVSEKSFDIATDYLRIAVPHQIIMHRIFDNLVNVFKASLQLQHRFKTGRNDYILKKVPEKPKHVPRISFRTKAMLFDMEDGAFDWKLGMIYRVGLVEQKQRIAREEAYWAKANAQPAKNQHYTKAKEGEESNETKEERKHNIFHFADKKLHGRHSRQPRYDPEGQCPMPRDAEISKEQAWERLQRHNAQSWKKRIDSACRLQNRSMQEIRGIFWGTDHFDSGENHEKILAMPERPGLLSILMSDLHVMVGAPSFPLEDYPQFLHSVGKGIPLDTQYSLLLPMSLQIDTGEARFTLRDYPLPLLHIPAIKSGQSPRLPAWSLKTDFVIAEEFRGDVSTRDIAVQVIPANKFGRDEDIQGFAIDVRRTVSPVKTYSQVDIKINTSAPTVMTWGTSLQPAIQDMMMVLESFTKPQLDPSERCGFWDKIRLVAHSRVNVSWLADGDVHLNLKGSRDPYVVTGHGAGFVMVWRRNVQWQIHQNDDPKKFMTVNSGEYVLAIPDFSQQARESSMLYTADSDSVSSSSSNKNTAHFKKTIMKLEGEVQWLAGLVFEGKRTGEQRTFTFRPHYDITLRTAEKARQLKSKSYDAFEGFRSEHIHMSVAVVAPLRRDWSTFNATPSVTYNSVHLSPKFFTHFFDWWSTFSGVMSLPVRSGPLFPGVEKSSKKFGRHLATFKYNLFLSPFFVTHMYKHKDVEEYNDDTVFATGLKLRLGSFMLDLHQRRETFATDKNSRGRQIKTSAMKINQAQLDFTSADLRAISAKIKGTGAESLKHSSDERLANLSQTLTTADLSLFTIPDNDFDWVDMDDFTELDWILPTESNPETKILPLAYAPRFTYFRQTDHPGSQQVGISRTSDFGSEPTHFCVMSQDNDPRRVQCQLFEQRLQKLREQLDQHERLIGEQELKVIRDTLNDHKDRFEELKSRHSVLQQKRQLITRLYDRLRHAVDHNEPWTSTVDSNSDALDLEIAPMRAGASDFNNRFIVHNVQLKWNNDLRNIILRYVHQVSQRRGFVYYLSRRAVKFILDIVHEQNKGKSPATSSPAEEPTENVEEWIQDLLKDGKKEIVADDSAANEAPSEDHIPVNTYLVHLIAPQIQLQSEKNATSVLLVTAKNMQLRVIQVMDRKRLADEVSGLVSRRFLVEMDSVQFFVTNTKLLQEYQDLHLGSSYGARHGTIWPPWVPFEVNFDFELNPFGWHRVVSKTSASLRYDKHNALRISHQEPTTVHKIDHIWIDFPHIRATCDSLQYYTMYAIALDLLLYSEPLEKVRSERLEKIMLASDFSDLRGAPRMVQDLQTRIRQLQEIKCHFQMHQRSLDRRGWQDHLAVEQDLASCEDELFFLMKAITTSQRKGEGNVEPSQSSELLQLRLSATEIVWHLMQAKTQPLMEIQLKDAEYKRIDLSDGSNHNSVGIGHIQGLNLLPSAIYPEMLGPYMDGGRLNTDKMFLVSWHSLEAIAGIPILDAFEVDLFPLKIQLEREIGQRAFEYIFPSATEEDAGLPSEDPPQYPETHLRPTTKSPAVDGLTSSVFKSRHSRQQNGIKGENAMLEHSPNSEESLRRPSANGSTVSLPKHKGFTLRKKVSTAAMSSQSKGAAGDDLSLMLTRASNYMTLAHVKIPSVTLCLSYKGKGERNIEDVHNFVFRMPMLEYRNKTWSNLDLALRLKKDIMRALISHTGAIIGNKLSHHRPSKHQADRLREMALASALLPNDNDIPNTPSSSFDRPVGDLGGYSGPMGSEISTVDSRRLVDSDSSVRRVDSNTVDSMIDSSTPDTTVDSKTTHSGVHPPETRPTTADGPSKPSVRRMLARRSTLGRLLRSG